MVKQDEHGRWYVVGKAKKYARRKQAETCDTPVVKSEPKAPVKKVGLLRRLYVRDMD